jgi:hypothetical protein
MISKSSIIFSLILALFFISAVEANELAKAEHFSDKSQLELIFQNKLADGESASQQVINNTSLKQLNTHRWKLIVMRGVDEPTLPGYETVFDFSEDFKFRVMLPCSYIQGKYEADDSGNFVLRQLNFSNRDCNTDKHQEVLLKTMLLSVDEFFINDQSLILGTQGKSSLGFVVTDKTLDAKALDLAKKKRKTNTNTKAKIKTKSGEKAKAKTAKSSHKKGAAQSAVKGHKKSAPKASH